MKRLIFSGLLALAAASCGSETKVADVQKHFCGGALVASEPTNDDTFTSCAGAYWTTGGTDKKTCEDTVAANASVKDKASADLKKLIDDNPLKFANMAAVCGAVGISN